MDRTPYTLAHAYRDIRSVTEPWVAINEFLHEWYDYSRDQREQLLAQPPAPFPDRTATDLRLWAVFLVALAEWLCEEHRVPCPSWVDNPACTLDAPWYVIDAPGLSKSHVRERRWLTTPEPFRRRNVICGDRFAQTKYSFAESAR